MVRIDDLRETRKDQEYGETDDKNMSRRLIVLMPSDLQNMIRKLYTVQELPLDKAFFRKFAHRYEQFKIPDKV